MEGLSTLPVSGFYKERSWFWPCKLFILQLLECSPLFPDTPARRRSPHSTCLCTLANSQTGPWAAGSRSVSTSPSGEELGLSARGFPNWLLLGQQDAAVPLCQSFGSGRMADLFPPQRLVSVREAMCAHTGVVAGTATVSSNIEQRCQQPPPQAAISASPPNSEG